MLAEFYSEDVSANLLLHHVPVEDGDHFLPFSGSPERLYTRPTAFTTSPSPESNLSELMNSNSQSLNASVEFNQSDEEKPNFDTILPRERWTREVISEELQLPRINSAKAGIQLIELTAGWSRPKDEESFLFFRQPYQYLLNPPQFPLDPTPPQLQLRPIFLEAPRPTPVLPSFYTLGTIANPITIEDDITEETFSEVKGKYQVIEKIGEGTFSSVYKARPLFGPNKEVVALKRIYSTCRPQRILNEILHLKNLGGKCFVPPLLGGLRHRDQVTLVLPYFEHDKFKDYLPGLSLAQIKQYMKALLEALHHLHTHQVIHRDIKPGNFLYDMKGNRFMLVDFGLAQSQTELIPPSSKITSEVVPTVAHATRKRANTVEDNSENKRSKTGAVSYSLSPINAANILNSLSQTQSAVADNGNKKIMQAPRAGTRGFRAPEVLMKYPYQTVAIDIWSAGIIFLCILSMRYPFFNSPDDLSALAEIGALCGTKEVREVAVNLGRRVHFPFEIPSIGMKATCTRLSGPRTYQIPESAYDLLSRCLDVNPFTRISASEALKHPFFNDK